VSWCSPAAAKAASEGMGKPQKKKKKKKKSPAPRKSSSGDARESLKDEQLRRYKRDPRRGYTKVPSIRRNENPRQPRITACRARRASTVAKLEDERLMGSRHALLFFGLTNRSESKVDYRIAARGCDSSRMGSCHRLFGAFSRQSDPPSAHRPLSSAQLDGGNSGHTIHL
jgi:hypothetical protein